MKKYSQFIFNMLSLLYLESVFGLLMFDTFLKTTMINVFLFVFIIAILITILTSLFKDKVNKIITYIIFGILGILFSTQFILKKSMGIYFSLNILKIANQLNGFKKESFNIILTHGYGIILFLLPIIVLIIFRKKIIFEKANLRKYIIILLSFILSLALFYTNINLQKKDNYSIYQLYFNVDDVSLNVEKTGVINSGCIDLYRSIFGFNEKLNEATAFKIDDSEEIFEYGYNDSNIDFSKLSTNNNSIKMINQYMQNEMATKKSKYSGIFEGKNLIYVVAESFSEIAVSEELTPTLYKLTHNGFVFNNFYTPNNLSTIGGEFQALTGLYADASILWKWRSGTNSFPYGLANVFKKKGYNTYAYHNHYYTFQDRNIYLKSMGFDNFKGCYNGLEKSINCTLWPESDVEMVNATINDYLKSDKPFITYYMTVSGHFQYDWYNSMASKHKDKVDSLKYSDSIKAYIATQIELDKALETLINKLTQAKKLDDTVIVLLCDHYPYALSINEINEVSKYARDKVVEVNHNNLIIWNNKLKTVNIDKTAMSIDVIPTVYNLFGVEYDSRLIVGKDILSNADGLAFFNNRSWVTGYGTYFANTGETRIKNDLMTKDYINNINNIVSNRKNISRLIVDTDYYRYVLK